VGPLTRKETVCADAHVEFLACPIGPLVPWGRRLGGPIRICCFSSKGHDPVGMPAKPDDVLKRASREEHIAATCRLTRLDITGPKSLNKRAPAACCSYTHTQAIIPGWTKKPNMIAARIALMSLLKSYTSNAVTQQGSQSGKQAVPLLCLAQQGAQGPVFS
jgi:hypothetical protein